MSRTFGHNIRTPVRISKPVDGHCGVYLFEGCWTPRTKAFVKRMVNKCARRNAKSEIRSALREADSLEVAVLTHRENVNAEVQHVPHDKYCLCAQCLQEIEDSWNHATSYADSCGDPYCEYCGYAPVCAHCGQYECEGTCHESFETEDDWNERSMHMVHN